MKIIFSLLFWTSTLCFAASQSDEREFKEYVDTLVDFAAATNECREVYVSLGCFGLEPCRSLEKLKENALLPFSSVGLRIHAIENYWRKTEGYNSKGEYHIDLYEVPESRRKKPSSRTELIYTESARSCAITLGRSLGEYIRLEQNLPHKTTLPVVPFNGSSHRKLIMFDWKGSL